jgi:hypothetical protein
MAWLLQGWLLFEGDLELTKVEGAEYVAGCDSQPRTTVDEPYCREFVGRGLLDPEEGD